jgi:hypothetical protein
MSQYGKVFYSCLKYGIFYSISPPKYLWYTLQVIHIGLHILFLYFSVVADYAARLENLFSTEAYAQICRAVFSPRLHISSLPNPDLSK